MTDRALMEQRAAHRHGRRYARVGDVFVDPSAPAKGEAMVIKVERPPQRGSHASTRAGKAWLLWTNRQGKQAAVPVEQARGVGHGADRGQGAVGLARHRAVIVAREGFAALAGVGARGR